MTREEYADKSYKLKKEYDAKQTELDFEYAESNREFKVGDVIEDHMQKIIVQTYRPYKVSSHTMPGIKYSGPRLTAKGVPYKNGEIACVYSDNIKKS